MGYIEAFRNTLVVDTLELVGLVKLPHHYQRQPSEAPETPQAAETPEGHSQGPTPDSERTLPATPVDHLADEEKNQPAAKEYPADEITEAQAINGDTPEFVQAEEKPVADPFLVDWNGPNDTENPLNWPKWKKRFTVFEMMLYTTVTYMGSSIYTPGQGGVEQTFHVGHVPSALLLSIYVLGYATGPLIFSPLSEVAAIGRNHIYMGTLFMFAMFQIGCALAPNYGGLVVLRFITGFLSSPAISTGGATMGDIITPDVLSYYIALWAVGAVAAPVIGPLLGASMVDAYDWRWIFWFLLIVCGGSFLIFVFFFPETFGPNILHRRANRIRRATGDNRYYTLQEREDSKVKPKDFFIATFYRPFAMIIEEPGVLAFDLYIALAYGCFYLFFESFPIVFIEVHHFTLVQLGLAFLGFEVGCIIGWIVVAYFLKTRIIPRFMNGTFVPENYLVLAMWVCFLLPISLLLFGWTAQVHWILPIIWEIPFVIAVFNIFQCAFGYFAMSYPRYLASVFAGNAVVRSAFAAAFPLFGKAMYDNLATRRFPVGWGSTLLAFLTLGMCVIPFVMHKYGGILRGRSKYAN